MTTVSYTRTPILPLPSDVAERIAAGEVIERPVSVVKELVENALDAQARDIRGLIRVTDDGYGIPENELELALARHSTSKISSVEDLSRLHTLGFRGEALASVGAVSELTILSRAIETEESGEEQPAAFLTFRGGEVTQRGYKARLHGTTITVRDLFYNVPARLKFIRSSRTENGHIIQLMRRFAVGYPDVRFQLAIDESIMLQTSGSGDLARTLAELYHLPHSEMLNLVSQKIEIEGEQPYRLHGYVGNRALAQNNRQHVTLFINGRWVQSRALYEALESGYRGLLPVGKHPLLVLRLELPPQDLDANVHPSKTEVRLVREGEVAQAITRAIRAVLERSPALPDSLQLPGPTLVYQRRLPGPHRRGLHVSETAEGYHAEEANPGSAEVLATLQPLAQLQQAVILAEAPDGSLYLIDQHRAHERVIYEHLRRVHLGVQGDGGHEEIESHLLLEPVVVELKRHEAELLEQRLPILHSMGIECERFGGRSFLVRSVPGSEGYEQLVSALPELARVAAEDSNDWQDHLLISLACRSAMRRGRVLGRNEQLALISNLAQTTAPAVCPHGGPILLHYSRTFLIEKFDW